MKRIVISFLLFFCMGFLEVQGFHFSLGEEFDKYETDVEGHSGLRLVEQLTNSVFDKWFKAVRDNNIFIVEKHLDTGSAIINTWNNGTVTALHVAADCGHNDMIKLLISRGAEVNSLIDKVDEMESPGTPLECAVRGGHDETVLLLLEHGADPNKARPGDLTPLQYAVKADNVKIGQLLLIADAYIHAHTPLGRPLHIALLDKPVKLNALKMLLEWDADCTLVDRKRVTPLHLAAMNSLEATQLLVAAGAQVNAQDENLDTPLDYAERSKNEDCVTFLLESGAEPVKEREYETFIDCDWDGKLVRSHRTTSLHLAPTKSLEATRRFVAAGGQINEQNENWETPLHYAVWCKQVDCIEFLLLSGANPFLKDYCSSGPNRYRDGFLAGDIIEYALSLGHWDTISSLIKLGYLIVPYCKKNHERIFDLLRGMKASNLSLYERTQVILSNPINRRAVQDFLLQELRTGNPTHLLLYERCKEDLTNRIVGHFSRWIDCAVQRRQVHQAQLNFCTSTSRDTLIKHLVSEGIDKRCQELDQKARESKQESKTTK